MLLVSISGVYILKRVKGFFWIYCHLVTKEIHYLLGGFPSNFRTSSHFGSYEFPWKFRPCTQIVTMDIDSCGVHVVIQTGFWGRNFQENFVISKSRLYPLPISWHVHLCRDVITFRYDVPVLNVTNTHLLPCLELSLYSKQTCMLISRN